MRARTASDTDEARIGGDAELEEASAELFGRPPVPPIGLLKVIGIGRERLRDVTRLIVLWLTIVRMEDHQVLLGNWVIELLFEPLARDEQLIARKPQRTILLR